MGLVFALIFVFILSLLTACQHYDPMDTFRQDKPINIAIINSESYQLIPHAHCVITTDTQDDVDTRLNPDMILLSADYKTLSLSCDAPGYQQNAIAITNRINHWSANDLFILPGNVVDASSSLLPYYPSHVLVLMKKSPFTAPATIEKNYRHAKTNDLLYQGMLPTS